MKTLLVLLIGCASVIILDAQTNSIVFPQLLSATNSVLMTNAEFRAVSGSKLIFKANDSYQSFEARLLNEDVLKRLGITVSQLESNKAAALRTNLKASLQTQETTKKQVGEALALKKKTAFNDGFSTGKAEGYSYAVFYNYGSSSFPKKAELDIFAKHNLLGDTYGNKYGGLAPSKWAKEDKVFQDEYLSGFAAGFEEEFKKQTKPAF